MRFKANVDIDVPEEGMALHLKDGHLVILHEMEDIATEGEYIVNTRTTERFGPVLYVTFPFQQVAAAWRNKGETDGQKG